MPLRKMVKDCGKEAVEEKLDAFEADVAEEKATAMAAAMADAGIVWFIPGLSRDVLGFCLSRGYPGISLDCTMLHHAPSTLHIVRNLYFQRGSLRLTGSLSVRAEGLLKVKVRDSVGAKAY